jgi:ABC-type nitrate/sulfonate/bicarbonate transport system permease component
MKKLALALWLPLCLLVLWQVLTSAGALDPLFFPAPTTLVITFGQLSVNGELLRHLHATFSRTAIGFLAGSVLGLGLGLLVGAWSPLRRSLEPLIAALYATPKLSLFPMLLLFLGVGDASRVALIALGSFVFTVIYAQEAVRNIPPGYVEMAVNYGARRMTLFREVYWPACLPQIFTGLRLALGRALVMAISVELVSSSDGLGSMIWLSWQTFSTERLYVAVCVTGTLGASLHYALQRLERRLIPWKTQNAQA